MTQLLVIAPDILCIGPFTETDTDIIAPDIIFPKSIIPGWEIVDATLPDGFQLQDYQWIGGELVPKYIPPPQISPEQAKRNYVAMMLSRAGKLRAEGKTTEALTLELQVKGII